MKSGADDWLAPYHRLLAAYGPQHWWPGDTPFEVMVGAVLTQNTAWTNVERAIANLTAAGRLSCHGILALPDDDLAELIRPAGRLFQRQGQAAQGPVRLPRRSGRLCGAGASARTRPGTRAAPPSARRAGRGRGDGRLHPALRPQPAGVRGGRLYTPHLLASGVHHGQGGLWPHPAALHVQSARRGGALQRIPRPHRAPGQVRLPATTALRRVPPQRSLRTSPRGGKGDSVMTKDGCAAPARPPAPGR